MKPPFESEIRAQILRVLGGAALLPPAARVHLPARDAHASIRLPAGTSAQAVLALDFGALYGAQLVSSLRVVNGWLLFDFSPDFFCALVERVNQTLPLPSSDEGNHAINRMLSLQRHSGSGCPDHPAFHRALLLAVVASASSAARQKAERAAETLFHTIAPKDRPPLLPSCGALGGALARLLAL